MNVVEFTRPQHRINQVRDLMRVAMDTCLTELGYTRFRLTEAQRERLSHLRYGQPERHAFLHNLASDPAVLAAAAGVEPTRRAETVPVSGFVAMARELANSPPARREPS